MTGLTSHTNVSAWLASIEIRTRWHPTLPVLSVEIHPAGGTGSVTVNLSPAQLEQLRDALTNTPAQPGQVTA